MTVYAPEYDVDADLPTDVTRHKAFVFREIPSTMLVINWDFDIDGDVLRATATNLNGEPFGRCVYTLEPGFSLSVEDLETETKQMAMTRNRLFSKNQSVRLLLQGSLYQLHSDGIVWSYASFSAAPFWRLYRKTNVAALRFRRWITGLREGKLTMLDSPDRLA